MAEQDPDLLAFFVQKPVDVYRLKSLEIYHPDFGVHRYVTAWQDQTLGIESGAPRNAGEQVLFTAFGISWPDPSQNDTGDISVPLNLGRVASNIKQLLKQITLAGTMQPIEMVLRDHLSSDLTEPKNFYYLYAGDINFQGLDVSTTCSDVNPTKLKTARVYTFEDFPALQDT